VFLPSKIDKDWLIFHKIYKDLNKLNNIFGKLLLEQIGFELSSKKPSEQSQIDFSGLNIRKEFDGQLEHPEINDELQRKHE
jgi:hypothetical protein